jgi:CheY-like chemotaxis protein
MRVLVADDDLEIARAYRFALEKNNHEVIITTDGEECIRVYRHNIEQANRVTSNGPSSYLSFDAVILDYKMPKKDGIEVAKEILEMNSNQRIIFASAYVEETLEDAVKQLKRVVELMQKPFDASSLVDTIEDMEIYGNLKNLMKSVHRIRGDQPTQKQLKDLLESLRKIQKHRTF